MDGAKLAEFAAKTLDDLDRDDDLPAGATLRDALLVLEVHGTDADGEDVSIVEAFVMSESDVVGIGLAMRALGAMMDPD
jgi:hypothetical protein